MQFAAAWGLTFRCDPSAVLRADEKDLAVLYATYEVAQAQIERATEKAKREAQHGKR